MGFAKSSGFMKHWEYRNTFALPYTLLKKRFALLFRTTTGRGALRQAELHLGVHEAEEPFVGRAE